MASRLIPRRPVSLVLQVAHLRRYWPALNASIRRGVLRAEGLVTPSPLSAPYLISLTYALDRQPQVRVVEPRIVSVRGDDPVPHVYDRSGDPRPCLFFPDGREWHVGRNLATTVVPWLLLWLTFYEIWLATGVWLGGGFERSKERS